mmetsp:Transcript_41446/g.47796  ORF Transcript_41446/g.47796 Transcript_41446/m.47796 type:complete len:145 (+) Transcript_41446:163-597(+)
MRLECLNKLSEKYTEGFPTYLGKIDVEEFKAIVVNDLDGVTLKELLLERDAAKQLTQEEFLNICVKLVELIQQVHEQGYVFSNIEPENIFVLLSPKHGVAAKLDGEGAQQENSPAELPQRKAKVSILNFSNSREVSMSNMNSNK